MTPELMENTVLFLYRQRLSRNPSYSASKQYINQLVKILDPDSPKAKFIVLSEAFAKAFTFPAFQIQYPFFQRHYPTAGELERLVNSLAREEVAIVDYEALFEIVYMLKMLGEQR